MVKKESYLSWFYHLCCGFAMMQSDEVLIQGGLSVHAQR